MCVPEAHALLVHACVEVAAPPQRHEVARAILCANVFRDLRVCIFISYLERERSREVRERVAKTRDMCRGECGTCVGRV